MMRSNLRVHPKSTPNKTKKPSHYCEGFLLLAPPIGESYNFNAMIAYSIIRKLR